MTITDIAITTPETAAIPSTWEASWRLARRIAATPFVPTALRGRPESVLAAILFGAELGIGPMQSLSSIHVIEGRPAASPELMRALIARAGHRIDVVEAGEESVTLTGQRADTGATATVTWSMDDARRAGLANKGTWKSYPRAMLLARATSELARMLFPDVVSGLSYTPDEVSSIESPEWTDEPTGPVPDADDDPAVVLYKRLRGVAGTEIAAELREVGSERGRRLTAAEFNAYPEWRLEVQTRLEQLLAEHDVVDAEVVDDSAVTAAVIEPLDLEALHARVVAAAGTPTGDQLIALAERTGGRVLTIEDFEAHPMWAQVVAEVLDLADREGLAE